MYKRFYGLTSLPFSLQPDPGVFYFGAQFAKARTILDYAILRREGILVITGDGGCGKTMLIRHFLADGAGDRCVGVISNPSSLKETLMTALLMAFGQQIQADEGALLYASFQAFLRAQHAAGNATILIVDEAQSLSFEMLEELRLLTNPESDGNGSLQLVLVGQSQLQQLLYRPELSQLLQRVVAHSHLQPLGMGETVEYVVHRLQCAGCERAIFTPAAMSRIFHGAQGIPRLINMICDVALLYGYAEQLQEIDEAVVAQVVADRGLGEPVPELNSTDTDVVPALPSAPWGATEPSASEWEIAEQLFNESKKRR